MIMNETNAFKKCSTASWAGKKDAESVPRAAIHALRASETTATGRVGRAGVACWSFNCLGEDGGRERNLH